jgi:hypothetical protein
MQAIVRSKSDRRKLHRSLAVQSEAQEEEIRQWSVLIVQKVARGYIARRTVLRSMQIRKSLSKEVLRIAERYLKHGDLWGFLKDINDELTRSNNVILENNAREDNWASNFVERVIHKRQAEFNTSWEQFPKALSEFTGAPNAVASLNGKTAPRGGSGTGSVHSKALSQSAQGSSGFGGGTTAREELLLEDKTAFTGLTALAGSAPDQYIHSGSPGSMVRSGVSSGTSVSQSPSKTLSQTYGSQLLSPTGGSKSPSKSHALSLTGSGSYASSDVAATTIGTSEGAGKGRAGETSARKKLGATSDKHIITPSEVDSALQVGEEKEEASQSHLNVPGEQFYSPVLPFSFMR